MDQSVTVQNQTRLHRESFFCQKSRDPDQENTFQKSGTELYIVAFSWVLSSNENPSKMSSKACFVTNVKQSLVLMKKKEQIVRIDNSHQICKNANQNVTVYQRSWKGQILFLKFWKTYPFIVLIAKQGWCRKMSMQILWIDVNWNCQLKLPFMLWKRRPKTKNPVWKMSLIKNVWNIKVYFYFKLHRFPLENY